jgi:hypothetical protein
MINFGLTMLYKTGYWFIKLSLPTIYLPRICHVIIFNNKRSKAEKIIFHLQQASPKTSPSTHALARAIIFWEINISYCLITPSLQIIRRFGFSGYIVFATCLDSTSIWTTKAIWLKLKTSYNFEWEEYMYIYLIKNYLH